jgi:hypothetical protein
MKDLLKYILLLFLLLHVISSPAQIYNSFNNNSLAPVDRIMHRAGQNLHSSVRPVRLDEVAQYYNIDSLIQRGIAKPDRNLNIFGRFLSNDFLKFNKDGVCVRINPLFNFESGKNTETGENWFINTRGAVVEGQLGSNIGFYSDIRENQATFPDYINEFANQYDIVPGQGKRKSFGDNGHDFAQSTGYLSYNAGSWFNFRVGFGKNFIGDGYRSLLLSDNTYSYPHLLVTATFLKAKYWMMIGEFKHFERNVALGDTRFQSKYGSFHYLNWNLTDRFSFGLFESVIWAAEDTIGYRGIDVNYLMPLTVFRPVEYNIGSPDNITMGINLKYIPWEDAAVYGQFVLGEFMFDEVFSGNKWWANKHGFLTGLEVFDLFGIQNLDFQTEYSQVRPYTYSHYDPITNYGHFYQELAHPLGANFRESISFLKYRAKRLHFELKIQYAIKGLDESENTNYGGNIHKPSKVRIGDYDQFIGQGLKSELSQTQLNVIYLINPRNNMNLTVGLRHRNMSNRIETENGNYIYAAFRTSLENVYYDFF